MNIKSKMLLGSGLMTIAPLLIVSIVIGWQAINEGEKALREQIVQRLVASRDDKAVQIENYFTGIRDQLTTFSHDQMFIDAMLSFKDAFANIKEEVLEEQSTTNYRKKLLSYYQNQYSNYFKKLNPGKQLDSRAFVNQLSDPGVVLQVHYAANNPSKIIAKDALDNPDDDTLYSQIHSLYHKKLREFKQRFGYYDIFLIETENNNIVYSVNKEGDFAASVDQELFKNSQLAKVYLQAKNSNDPNFVAISDFSLYSGSFNLVSAFVAAPIIDDEEHIGVLVFQIPQHTINRIMTSGEKWKQVGMGDSGETYLVGNDSLARSISRPLLENPQQFYKQFEANSSNSTTSKTIAKTIQARNSNVFLEKINTNAVGLATTGKKGFKDLTNDLDIEVMSAYAPLPIPGLKWVIISEINKQEALAPVQKLSKKIIISAIIIFVILLIFASITGLIFANSITKPIIVLSKGFKYVKENSDLSHHIKSKQNNEFGLMAKSFNAMLSTFHQSIKEVSIAVNFIASAAKTLMNRAEQTKQAINIQNMETLEIAENISNMLNKTNEVNEYVAKASLASDNAVKDINSGQKIVSSSINSVEKVAKQITQSADSIEYLRNETENIGSVVDVIKEIAEQTNLLALNAAIEAARAGEQGRGFAVVADEVRALAAKTQNATIEIQDMVEKLQKGSNDSAQIMGESKTDTQQVVEQSKQVMAAFETISHAVSEISGLNKHISLAVDEQKTSAEKIHINVDKISQESTKTTSASDEIASSSEVLTEMSTNLQSLVNQFKI
ncbi:MAG: HAMP domain-containing methyl-accepting chemotaxis protein [Pseudomonadota bacterium]